MKNVNIKLKIDSKKYEAVQQFMEEKGLDVNQELSETVYKLYKKHVPSSVRKYIERNTSKDPKATLRRPIISSESTTMYSNYDDNSNNSCQ